MPPILGSPSLRAICLRHLLARSSPSSSSIVPNAATLATATRPGFPLSIQELISQWVPGRPGIPKRIVFTLFAGLSWAIWKNRNKMAIEKCFPLNPDPVIHMAINHLQMWADLSKEADKQSRRNLRNYRQCTERYDWLTWRVLPVLGLLFFWTEQANQKAEGESGRA
ncbi:unnamed protein product [Miscanthus lutarioriparius]|uniref:Uncharacterized protein n=1 Tax=Miscanthus lutarioriparius TaxID=422564 RepID=A0A811PYD5_9POAL|nr:unnamed protein product [Miscanthus lutarioriparius]